MTKNVGTPLRDDELVAMLGDDPELLAIADGLVATREHRRESHRRGKHRAITALAAGGAVITLVGLLLASPWQGKGSLVSRALAAVGQEPVLHVVLEERADRVPVIDVRSGQRIPQRVRTEIWFDEGRDSKKAVSTIQGKPFGLTLETPQSRPSDDGFVYTCGWIAEHPVEAAAAGVSCGDVPDRSEARSTERQSTTLDPALSNFVDHYRSALASGSAHRVGPGEIDGRDVVWLEFDVPGGAPADRQRVALDAETSKPLLVESGTRSFNVLNIETVPFEPRFFAKTRSSEQPTTASVSAESVLDARTAAHVLGVPALWLGQRWQNLQLVAVKRQELTTHYSRALRPTSTLGVEYRYALLGRGDARPALVIREATSCPFVYGWSCGAADPPNGALALGGGRNLLRVGELYVSIWDFRTSDGPSVLEIARSLTPVTNTRSEG
jgi:hypothetical protein